jgi:hypothetical protein
MKFSTTFVFAGLSDIKSIKAKYRELSKVYHPDCGGSADNFRLLNEQFQQAIKSIELPQAFVVKKCVTLDSLKSLDKASILKLFIIFRRNTIDELFAEISKGFEWCDIDAMLSSDDLNPLWWNGDSTI